MTFGRHLNATNTAKYVLQLATFFVLVALFPGLLRLQFFDRLKYAKTEREGL